MKAMIFAAGLGTRLSPFTDFHPKALALVNGKTLLERNIDYLNKAGIEDIIINIHHFGDQIKSFLIQNKNFGCNISLSDEKDEVLETGGGMLKAKEFLHNEDFLLMNVDILTSLNLHKLIAFHFDHNPLVTLAVSDRESSRKLLFDEGMNLCGWKNFNTGEEIITKKEVFKLYAFSGIHIVSHKIFEKMNEKGKFSIMKTYMRLMQTETIKGYNHTGDMLIDVGKPESILKAEKYFK